MKILLIKTSALGDVIHAYPVVDYLHKHVPGCVIHWVVEERCSALVADNPHVERVITIDSRRWRISEAWRKLRSDSYDVAFDLQGNIKSGLVLAYVKATAKVGFGWQTVAEWPNILFSGERYNPPPGHNIRDDYLFMVKSHFGDTTPCSPSHEQPAAIGANPRIVVSMGSRWRNKQATPESMADFLRYLAKDYDPTFLFIWGDDAEKAMAEQMCEEFSSCSLLVDKLTLPELKQLLGDADLVIAMDSLPLHLAATTATPTFSLFGASSQEKYRPLGGHHHSIQGSCPYGITFDKRCPRLRSCPTGACIREMTGEEMYNAFVLGTVKE